MTQNDTPIHSTKFDTGNEDTDAHNDYAPVALRVDPVLFRCWDIVKNNPVVTLLPALILVASSIGTGLLSDALHATTEVTNVLPSAGVSVIAFVLNTSIKVLLLLGVARIYLNLARGRAARLGMLFQDMRLFLPALAAYWLYSLAVGIGFVLLFIPGVILWMGLQFWVYLMVDRGLGPIQALERSCLNEWLQGKNILSCLADWRIDTLLDLIVYASGFEGVGFRPVWGLSMAVIYHALTYSRR